MLASYNFKCTMKVRQHARERFMKAATKIANRYNVKNTAKFKEGDLVTIRIPKIDCTNTDTYAKTSMSGG